MTSLRWIADGIAIAEAAGGVTLDRRSPVGFAGQAHVRPRAQGDISAAGVELDVDEDLDDLQDGPR